MPGCSLLAPRAAVLASLALASGCFFELSLDGKQCDDGGRCATGYVCGPTNTCIRPDELPAPHDDGGGPDDDGGAPVDSGDDEDGGVLPVDGGTDAGHDGGAPDDDGGADLDAGAGDASVDGGEPVDGGADGGADGGSDGGPEPLEYDVVTCEGAPVADAGSGTCAVVGSGGRLRLVGDVLTPGRVYEQGSVDLDETGVIQCVGCDCPLEPGTTTLVCNDAVISPGLINAHDHLSFDGPGPVALPVGGDPDERYEQRHDWRVGAREHTALDIDSSLSSDASVWAELRSVLGGATSTNASGAATGLLRNLDFAAERGPGLTDPAVENQTFPLGDSNGLQLASGCGYPNITPGSSADAYAVHVAEGIDAEARNELLCLTSTDNGGSDVLGTNTTLLGGLALLPGDAMLMAARDIKVVWSPRSNLRLYGDTAPVTLLDDVGVDIALGTDWLPTGSMNMLRELQCADAFNQAHLGGWFSDEDLWRMATKGSARAAAMDDAIGVLESNHLGDVAVFRNAGRRHYRAVLEARPEDVALVLLAGRPLSGDAALVEALETGCDPLDVCGEPKRVCLQREADTTLPVLTASVGNALYPLFACGVPDDEPACVPRRVLPEDTTQLGSGSYPLSGSFADGDGDGIVDESDNCATVFNPIRPLDDGVQADADADGRGDACDVCPLDHTQSCSPPAPGDRDGDSVPDDDDNCVSLGNPDQADGDSDGKGDPCDPCPAEPNPGTQLCRVSIYAVKSGDLNGARVAVDDMVVTAVTSNGFWAQLHPTADGYLGAPGSAVFVFTADGPRPSRGLRIDIASATVTLFFQQIQLIGAVWTVESADEELTATVVGATELSAMVADGPSSPFEGVLIEVNDAIVSNLAPPSGPGDDGTNEFELDVGLRVDDAVFLMEQPPATGYQYARLRGPVAWRNNYMKLLPRDADDVQTAP